MEQKVLGIVSPVPMGNWASNTVYQNLNIVRHNGASYIAKSSNTNIEPGVTVGWGSYWMLLNDDGEIGPTGPQGIPGEGVPPGGLAGYVLSKNSNTNYDSKWIPQNEVAAGSAEKDGQGNIIPDTYETKQNAQQIYETKSDSMQKYTSLQSQITQNTQNISRNSKRLDGLEQRINPSPFVTDNSVAYQKDVPSNAVGAVDIQVVGGMTYKDGDTLRSAPVTAVNSVGVNLFDISKLSGMDRLVVSGDKINVTTTPGNSGVTSASRIKDVAPQLKVGDIVTLTAITTGSDKYIYLEDALMPWYYGESKTITEVMLNSRITFYASGVSTSATISDIMLNKGSTALPYTPYVKHTLPIPEAVRPANGINENGYDYIEWAEDGSVKQIISCKKAVFDGSPDENWMMNQFSNLSAYIIPFPGEKLKGNIICDKFEVLPHITAQVDGTIGVAVEGVDLNNSGVFFGVKGLASSVEEWRNYLASNPVTVVVALANPIVTDISDLITSDNLIGVEGNGTITFENEYGYAVPSTVEYITAEATT